MVTNRIIKDSIADCFADETYIAIKGKDNFRYKVYADYKSSRKDTKMEQGLKDRLNAAYKYLLCEWNAVAADGMEADDLVSIWAYEARDADEDFVIGHIDKDINQIAGNHYNYNKKEIYFIDDNQADLNFCVQLLIGDAGDDIPKLKKGYGIKSAQKALANTTYDNRMSTVVDQWKRLYGKGWENQLNLVGNLIYMKRTWDLEEWNYEDRYKRETDVSKSNGRNTSDKNEERKELHADISN
jgi:5'-3' exonuclease